MVLHRQDETTDSDGLILWTSTGQQANATGRVGDTAARRFALCRDDPGEQYWAGRSLARRKSARLAA